MSQVGLPKVGTFLHCVTLEGAPFMGLWEWRGVSLSLEVNRVPFYLQTSEGQRLLPMGEGLVIHVMKGLPPVGRVRASYRVLWCYRAFLVSVTLCSFFPKGNGLIH